MKIGNREFDTSHHTYIMGILNVTPDSFSDGGKYKRLDTALIHAGNMLEEGADILDIGGESTRPGHQQISTEEEIQRVVPVIEKVKSRFDVPVSVDTYKPEVAKAALAAGADLINDIWGLKYDPEMASVIAGSGAACCLMHNRKEAEGPSPYGYSRLIPDMLEDLKETLHLARRAGIPEDKIILDPGVGFGKTYEMNLEVLKNLGEFQKLGFPLLLGASRKSVIGLTLDVPVGQREEGTLVTTVMAAWSGYAFVRVHDVRKNKRAVQMTEAIRNA